MIRQRVIFLTIAPILSMMIAMVISMVISMVIAMVIFKYCPNSAAKSSGSRRSRPSRNRQCSRESYSGANHHAQS
jgi:hypothetical protein